MTSQGPIPDRKLRDGWELAVWATFVLSVIILVAWAAFVLVYKGHQGQGAAGPSAGSPVAPSAAPSPPCSPAGPELHVSAQHISFDTACLAAPAGKPFTVVFDNKDQGIPHDVAIFTDSSATKALFTGKIVIGPKTITYHVGTLPPGTYFFHCDVHPSQMHGTFVVG